MAATKAPEPPEMVPSLLLLLSLSLSEQDFQEQHPNKSFSRIFLFHLGDSLSPALARHLPPQSGTRCFRNRDAALRRRLPVLLPWGRPRRKAAGPSAPRLSWSSVCPQPVPSSARPAGTSTWASGECQPPPAAVGTQAPRSLASAPSLSSEKIKVPPRGLPLPASQAAMADMTLCRGHERGTRVLSLPQHVLEQVRAEFPGRGFRGHRKTLWGMRPTPPCVPQALLQGGLGRDQVALETQPPTQQGGGGASGRCVGPEGSTCLRSISHPLLHSVPCPGAFCLRMTPARQPSPAACPLAFKFPVSRTGRNESLFFINEQASGILLQQHVTD